MLITSSSCSNSTLATRRLQSVYTLAFTRGHHYTLLPTLLLTSPPRRFPPTSTRNVPFCYCDMPHACRAYVTSMTSVSPSVNLKHWWIKDYNHTVANGNTTKGEIGTWQDRLASTCMLKPTRIVISCDLEFYWRILVAYWIIVCYTTVSSGISEC